ncbi:hypothetical protein AB0M39_10475 [Streptomyces sp. NPDC051907]|uniref:hypothetical protein n=1 Tax=Streptomyces sp. NPDC051907 TaxID=3155284 RepID=UPI0034172338
MISEPELVGEGDPFGDAQPPGAVPGPRGPGGAAEAATAFGAPGATGATGAVEASGTGGAVGTAETVGAGGDEGKVPWLRRPWTRKPWVWGLGGALLASSLWAGGLYVDHRLGPDLRGYKTTGNLCEETGLKALTKQLGEMDAPDHGEQPHKNQSRAYCWATFKSPGADEKNEEEFDDPTSSVYVFYRLHRKVDPGPEFEASITPESRFSSENQPPMEKVEGLGDRAYFVVDEVTSAGPPSLHVLDGQAVLSIALSIPDSTETVGDSATTRQAYRDEMIADMKELMAKLKE